MTINLSPNSLGRIDPSELTYAPWNPKSRINPCDPDFLDLCESVKQHGQLMPVIVTRSGIVMDGNRRVSACSRLGFFVEYLAKDIDPLVGWREINNCRKDIKGRQLVEIASVNSDALTEKQRKRISRLSEAFGSAQRLDEWLITNQTGNHDSAATLAKASKIVTFCYRCHRTSPDDIYLAAFWAIRHRAVKRLPYELHHYDFATYRCLGSWLWAFVDTGSPLPEIKDSNGVSFGSNNGVGKYYYQMGLVHIYEAGALVDGRETPFDPLRIVNNPRFQIISWPKHWGPGV